MCASKSCLLATVPFPNWKSAPLATLPDHRSVLVGDARRTVSRVRISCSALAVLGASCAEQHRANSNANTAERRSLTICLLLSLLPGQPYPQRPTRESP